MKNKIISKLLIITIMISLLVQSPMKVSAASATPSIDIGTGFSYPVGMIATGDSIYVAEYNKNKVLCMDKYGNNITTLNNANSPVGIAITGGAIYVAEYYANKIEKISLDGKTVTPLGTSITYPTGLDLDSEGNIYVASYGPDGKVYKISADGSTTTSIATGFSYPYGLAVATNGAIYVADYGNNVIKKMNADGSNIREIWKGAAKMITLDSNGNLYAAASNSIIRMDGEGNNVITLATGIYPVGIEVDSEENVYYSTSGSIRKLISTAVTKDVTHIKVDWCNGFIGTQADPAAFTIHGVASNPTVTEVSVSGTELILTLSEAIQYSDSNITIDYTKTGTNNLTTVSELGNFTAFPVANNVTIAVTAVDSMSDITVDSGTAITSINLPSTTSITLSNTTTTGAAITWDMGNPVYNGGVANTYVFTGILTLPQRVTNPSNLKVKINVIVQPTSTPTSTPTATPTTTATASSVGDNNVRKIIVGDSSDSNKAVKVDVNRIIENNKKIDSVVLNADKVTDALKSLNSGHDFVIYVNDDANDSSDEFTVTVKKDSINKIGDSNVVLGIKTDDVQIILPISTIDALALGDQDLYFRIVPIKKDAEKQQVVTNTMQAQIVRETAENGEVTVYGTPMTIETNYQNQTTKIVFSLKDISIPTNKKEREEFLSKLAVYIEHSDGEKVVERGLIKYDEKGNPTGIEITIDKFSTFTIIGIDKPASQTDTPKVVKKNKAPKAVNVIVKGDAVVGKELSVSYQYNDADKDKQGKTLIQWYRADSIKGKNAKAISKATKTTYTLTGKDEGKYIFCKVTPVAKTGVKKGNVVSYSVKKAVVPTKITVTYKAELKLGLIGSKSYTYSIASIIKNKYLGVNVCVTEEYGFYRVTADFTDKVKAKNAAEDMIKDDLITNYSINSKTK